MIEVKFEFRGGSQCAIRLETNRKTLLEAEEAIRNHYRQIKHIHLRGDSLEEAKRVLAYMAEVVNDTKLTLNFEEKMQFLTTDEIYRLAKYPRRGERR
jgi:hypothetical protein